MWNLIYLVTGLVFIILLISVFYSKEVLASKENKAFKYILMANLLGYIIEIPLQILVRTLGIDYILVDSICRLYLISITISYSLFTIYVFIICFNKANKNYEKRIETSKKFVALIEAIIMVVLFITPYKRYYDTSKMYIEGFALDILKGYIVIQICLYIILLVVNHKKRKDKKYLPIYFVIVCLIFMTLLNSIDPSILITNMIGTFICYTMYFTIENPDLKMLREMEFAKNTAEKANRAKSDFLSSMSHEIRTPLNAIVGLSEDIASYKEQIPKEVVEDTEDIQNASQTLLEIVGNILDINKIESEKMEIVEMPYNYVEEITKMARITATRIGEKPIDFNMNFAPDIPYELLGDKAHIKAIVNNLLTNAIKYTEKGTITLNTKCINQKDTCMLMISVQDTGRGIKAEYINKLFTKFERLDIERNTTTEGTGLGLAITKALVDMMGGHINVSSQFGQGSIFVVQIPQKISKMVNPIQESQSATKTEIKVFNSVVENQDEKQFSDKRVLVVDDNQLNIKVARKHLESLGFLVEECESGEQCLDQINKGEKYDLILMDIMMPEMSGETTLSKLKEMSAFKVPVIALTADAVAGAKERYISLGFVDYIAKPFTKDQIKEKLDKLFINNINETQNPNQAQIKLTSENDTSDSSDAVTYVFDPTKKEEYVVINGKRKNCDNNNDNR